MGFGLKPKPQVLNLVIISGALAHRRQHCTLLTRKPESARATGTERHVNKKGKRLWAKMARTVVVLLMDIRNDVIQSNVWRGMALDWLA